MDKEKEIEDRHEIASIINDRLCDGYCTASHLARRITQSGYGNIKQAVKEFANNIIDLLEEMGMERSSEYNDGYDDGVADCITNIKSRITELYGSDE